MTDKTRIWLYTAAVRSFGRAIFGHFRILASHWLTRLDPCWLARGLARGGGGARSLQHSYWDVKFFKIKQYTENKVLRTMVTICVALSFNYNNEPFCKIFFKKIKKKHAMQTYNKGRVSKFYFEYTDWKKINTFIGLHMFWSNLFLHTAGVEKKEIYILTTMRKPISFFLSY